MANSTVKSAAVKSNKLTVANKKKALSMVRSAGLVRTHYRLEAEGIRITLSALRALAQENGLTLKRGRRRS
jgi:transposase